MAKITIQDLLEAGCHFGHQTKRWNPKMKHFVYGAKNGISIIDLTRTMYQINDACNFLQKVVGNGGDILFVGTKRQAQEVIREAAETTGMFYVSERWLGGTLTNNVTIRKSIARMAEIDKIVGGEESSGLKKKELSQLVRKNEKLHRDLDGIVEMKKLPAAMVVIDVCNDDIAVREARKLHIPIVAVVDTNGNPELIDYPVAANDDAVKSIKLIMDLFVDAIKVAAEINKKRVEEERIAKEAERQARKENEESSEGEDKKPRRRAPRKDGEPRTGARRAVKGKADEAAEEAPKAEAEEAPKAEEAPAAEEAPKAE